MPQPHECIARAEYERTRGLSAFNLLNEPVRKNRNQHATIYTFADNSQFIVYGFGMYAYRGTDGLMYARRTDYGNMPSVEFTGKSLSLLGLR